VSAGSPPGPAAASSTCSLSTSTVSRLASRRLFLHDISACPASRAAFEILTGLPVDWDRAARCLPQADEPWRKPAARDPALLLAGENGWLGEFAHGPDKKAELLAEVNQWRAERGLEPVGWAGESGEEGEPQQ